MKLRPDSETAAACHLERPATGARNLRLVVVAILVAAASLRVLALDRYPLPYHQDELTDIYDGYSIATTGADRTGERWPMLIRSMGPGGYCPTLNMYLCAVATAVGGFNVWAGRMPAVIGGMLTLWLVFVLARRLLGSSGGVLALLFVALSPIHILYSRQVHAGTYLPPLFALLTLYLLDRWMERTTGASTGAFGADGDSQTRRRPPVASCAPGGKRLVEDLRSAPAGLAVAPSETSSGLVMPSLRAAPDRPGYGWLVLAGLAIGFSTNAYSGSRITALLFAAVALVFVLLETGLRQRQWSWAIQSAVALTLAVLIGAAPTLYAAATMPEAFFSRGANIIPPVSNGPRWWLETLTANLAANLDPRYLFLSFGEYRHLSVERLGLAALPFLYVGLLGLAAQSVRKRDLRLALIPLAALIGLAPGVLSTGNPNPMRTSIVWSIYPIAAGYGALLLGRILMRLGGRARFDAVTQTPGMLRARLPRIGVGVVTASVVLCGVWYTARYVQRGDLHGLAAQRGYVEVGTWLRDHGKAYDRVYIDVDGVFGYLYVAALSGMTPAEFQQTPREGVVTAMGWDHISRLGRYHFKPIEQAEEDWQAARRNERWLLIQGTGAITELTPDARVTAATP